MQDTLLYPVVSVVLLRVRRPGATTGAPPRSPLVYFPEKVHQETEGKAHHVRAKRSVYRAIAIASDFVRAHACGASAPKVH